MRNRIRNKIRTKIIGGYLLFVILILTFIGARHSVIRSTANRVEKLSAEVEKLRLETETANIIREQAAMSDFMIVGAEENPTQLDDFRKQFSEHLDNLEPLFEKNSLELERTAQIRTLFDSLNEKCVEAAQMRRAGQQAEFLRVKADEIDAAEKSIQTAIGNLIAEQGNNIENAVADVRAARKYCKVFPFLSATIENSEKIYNRHQALQNLLDAQSIFWRQDAAVTDLFIFGKEDHITEFHNLEQSLIEILNREKSFADSRRKLKLLNALEINHQKLDEAYDKAMSLYLSDNRAKALELKSDEVNAARGEVQKDLEQLTEIEKDDLSLLLSDMRLADATTFAITKNLAIYIVILLFFALILGIIIALRITRPIGQLVKATQKLAGGDFTTRAEIGKRGEIGDLADSFNRMAENLQKTTVSKADLEAKVTERTVELGLVNENLQYEIVERKQTEEILRRRQQELSDFLDNATVGLHWIGADGHIIWANKAELDMLGYTSEEYIGRNIAEFHDDQKTIADILTRLGNNEVLQNYEARLRSKDGSIKYVLINSNVLWEDGKFVRTRCFSRDITERRGAEEKLRRSEASYRQLADSMPQIVWTAQSDGFIEYYNQRWFDYTELTFEQTKGLGWKTVLHPDDLQSCFDNWDETVKTGEKFEIEYRIRRASDGEYRWHLGQALPVRDAENQIVKWFGSCTDIHEQKKTEEELRQVQKELELRVRVRTLDLEKVNADLKDEIADRRRAETALMLESNLMQALMDNIPDAIYFKDLHSRFVKVGKHGHLQGIESPEEAVGKTDFDFYDEEHARDAYEDEQRIMRTGESVVDKLEREVLPNGEVRWVSTTKVPIFNAERVITGIVGVSRDVSERKQTEEEIRQSEEKYRNILETIEEGYFESDVKGCFTFVNDALCNLLGYSRDELMGVNYSQYSDEENADKISKLLLEVLQTNQPNRLSKWEIIRKDGERRIHESSVSPRRDEAREPIGFRGIVRDITELKRSEKELQESQQLLKLVVDTLPQAIWWKNSEGIYMGANRFIANVAGFDSPEEMIGLTDYDMPWTKEEADSYRKVDSRVLESGVAELNMIETQLQFDGRKATVTTNKVPFRNAGGEIVGVLGTFADITEQKRADAALRESEYKFRTLLESMSEGLLQVDDSDRIQFVNSRFCEMVGYSSDELMGTGWGRLLFDADERNSVRQINNRRNEGILESYELCLKKKSGEILWVIVGGAPILDAEGVVTGSMGVFTDITERKLTEDRLIHDAFHDGLTGLANRTLFTEHLQLTIERAKRDPDELFAVLFLDFDRFKVVNDSLGHAEGDNLLKQIARRLEDSLRGSDLVARLGGDEFTILLNKISDTSVPLRVAERIQKKLQVPFELGGGDIFTSASIGIALSTSGHERAEDMLRDADIAMYRAKAIGRAKHQVFDQAMHEQALAQIRIETELRQAIERKEFCLHYQPIINLQNSRIIGFESLVRWKHPEFGMIPPNDFISIAEENGLIIPLGQWILHESCRQLREWQISKPAALELTVSVNLSFKQFLQMDLAEQVAEMLEKTGLHPRYLKLEITESHIMENTETALKTMSSLRALGVQLSLDDFGTGYSSLSHLHRLPVNYLKIDRSFVTQMIESGENSEIVRTIVKLAQNLKMRVIAEGIETAEQLVQLKNLNCEYGQGYLFAKPLDAAAAAIYLDGVSESRLAESPAVDAMFN